MQINFVKLLHTAALTCCPREPSTKGERKSRSLQDSVGRVRRLLLIIFTFWSNTQKCNY